MHRLAPQPWMISAQRVMDALETSQPGCARFVGGCVRNALLGEPVADIDIATQLTPDRVEQVMGVEVESSYPLLCHVDGEPHQAGTTVSVRVRPGALPDRRQRAQGGPSPGKSTCGCWPSASC